MHDFVNNSLTGTIEYAPLYNLQELVEFYISRNNLTGEADAFVAPNLYEADFGNNTFTSMRHSKNTNTLFKISYGGVMQATTTFDKMPMICCCICHLRWSTSLHLTITSANCSLRNGSR